MLTYFAPLIVYILSIPVIIVSIFRVEIGILFFIATIPIISLIKKIHELPGGNNFGDFLLIGAGIGCILNNIRENNPIFKRSPVNVAVLILVFGTAINLVRGFTFMDLPEEVNLIRLAAWKNYMILPLIYFISVNSVDTGKMAKWIIITICFTMLAMDLNFYSTFRWMRVEHYRDSIRISGAFSFLGPNELGVFYTMYTFLLLGIAYYIKDKKAKYFILFVCACNFYPILYSYSRAAYSSTIIGLLTLAVLKDKRIFILLLVLVSLYSFILPTSVVERIDMTFLGEDSVVEETSASSSIDVAGVEIDTVGRKGLWEKAIGYFEAEPMLGIGFDTFRHKEGAITHSMYMKILAEQGLIGMAVFLLFTLVVLGQAYKLFRHSESEMGKGIGLGFVVCEMVHLTGSLSGDQSLYYNLMAIYWVFLGLVASFNFHLAHGSELAWPREKKNESSAI